MLIKFHENQKGWVAWPGSLDMEWPLSELSFLIHIVFQKQPNVIQASYKS